MSEKSRVISNSLPGREVKRMSSSVVARARDPNTSPAPRVQRSASRPVSCLWIFILVPQRCARLFLPQSQCSRPLDPAVLAIWHNFDHFDLGRCQGDDPAVVLAQIVAHGHPVNTARAIVDESPDDT